jgi:hypothetical protein
LPSFVRTNRVISIGEIEALGATGAGGVFALVAFFGEGDAAFGHDDATFGEKQRLQAGDDLEECAQVGRARVGTGGEFEKAQLELVLVSCIRSPGWMPAAAQYSARVSASSAML